MWSPAQERENEGVKKGDRKKIKMRGQYMSLNNWSCQEVREGFLGVFLIEYKCFTPGKRREKRKKTKRKRSSSSNALNILI